MISGKLAPLAVLLAACGADVAQDGAILGTSSAPVIGGADDIPEQFPGVVRITASPYMCSGTLVSANGSEGWVLTAAHCVLSPSGAIPLPTPAANFVVHVGPYVDGGVGLAATATVVHPGYDRGRFPIPECLDSFPTGIAFDLALIKVQGLTSAMAENVIPWLTPADDTLGPGSPGTLVGFGTTLATSIALPEVRQRADANVFATITTTPTGGNILLLDQRGDLPGFAPGDSGGPFVVKNAQDAFRVAGVISSGFACSNGLPSPEGFGAAQRVSPAVSAFLEPTIAGTALAATGCKACVFGAVQPGAPCHGEATSDTAAIHAFNACMSTKTFESCRASNPAGAAVYDGFWSCMTEVACKGICTAASRTRVECAWDQDGAGPCDACLQANCCNDLSVCEHDTACKACLNWTDTADQKCVKSAKYLAARGCIDTHCSAQCGEYVAELTPVPEAGAGDAAEAGDGPAANDGPPESSSPEASAPDGAAPALQAPLVDESGCSCRVPTRQAGPPNGALLLVLAGLLGVRRRD